MRGEIWGFNLALPFNRQERSLYTSPRTHTVGGAHREDLRPLDRNERLKDVLVFTKPETNQVKKPGKHGVSWPIVGRLNGELMRRRPVLSVLP